MGTEAKNTPFTAIEGCKDPIQLFKAVPGKTGMPSE
jgi:hypothetical protein